MIKFRDDEGAMPLALLITIVGLALSGTMSALLVGQLKNTGIEARRVTALTAAQAGLDVGLAQVRASVALDGTGDRTQLPCETLTGNAGTGVSGSYAVTATYFPSDPQGQSDAWVTANAIPCVVGAGPKDVPAFVTFTAVGTATQGSEVTTRTLKGTYVVHTTNVNIDGGLMHVYNGGNTAWNDLCIDAGSGTPGANDVPTMQLCSPGSVSQIWAYTKTLQIQLVASQTTANQYGMCLDAGSPHTNGAIVKMQVCQSTTPALYPQQWSLDDSSRLRGSKDDGSDIDGYCLTVNLPNSVGSQLSLSSSCGSGYENQHTWSPDAKVGAGQASSSVGQSIGQLVNYNQFGRCLDDTGNNINASYMIAWPCKQNPNPLKVGWNQRYRLPAQISDAIPYGTGQITVTYTDGTNYCVQSPMATAVGQYVTTKACVVGQLNQQWTVYYKTGQYATSYQIVDGTGKYCLTPRDPSLANPDLFSSGQQISKIYVAPCDGTTLQKWNADKNVIDAMALKDVNEK